MISFLCLPHIVTHSFKIAPLISRRLRTHSSKELSNISRLIPLISLSQRSIFAPLDPREFLFRNVFNPVEPQKHR